MNPARRERMRLSNSEPACEAGMISVTILVLMVSLIAFAFAVVMLIQSNYRNTTDYGKKIQALNIAEAGIDHINWRLRQNSNWNTISDEQNVTVSGGQYTCKNIDTDDNGHIRGIRVQGWVPSVNATNGVYAEVYAEMTYKASTLFSMAVLTKAGMTWTGSAHTNSFNSSVNMTTMLGNGDVGTLNYALNTIDFSGGNASVGGKVNYPGENRHVVAMQQWQWDQNKYSLQSFNPPTLSEVSIPSNAITVNAVLDSPKAMRTATNDAWNGPSGENYLMLRKTDGTYLGGSLDGSVNNLCSDGKPCIPAGTYHILSTGGVSINCTNNHVLRFGPGVTTLYLDGNMNLANNSSSYYCLSSYDKKPSSLTVYGGTNTTSVQITGSANVNAGLYLPNSSVSVQNSGMIYGALVANTASLSGNVGVYYDEALKNSSGSGSSSPYQISSWTQTR